MAYYLETIETGARFQGVDMTLCPVAIAVGCPKCPIFRVCPAKGIIGSAPEEESAEPEQGQAAGQDKDES